MQRATPPKHRVPQASPSSRTSTPSRSRASTPQRSPQRSRRGSLRQLELQLQQFVTSPVIQTGSLDTLATPRLAHDPPDRGCSPGRITRHTRTTVDTVREDIRKRKQGGTRPLATEAEWKRSKTGSRIQALGRVFAAFDLDGGGKIEAAELMELGKIRRRFGQKAGEWTEERNKRLVKRMDRNGDGVISEKEFSEFFEKALPHDEKVFDSTIEQFTIVAKACARRKAEAHSLNSVAVTTHRDAVIEPERRRLLQVEKQRTLELKQLADVLEEQQKVQRRAALKKKTEAEAAANRAKVEARRQAAMHKAAKEQAEEATQAKEQLEAACVAAMREQAEDVQLAATQKAVERARQRAAIDWQIRETAEHEEDARRAAGKAKEEARHQVALQKAEALEARQQAAHQQAVLKKKEKEAAEEAAEQRAAVEDAEQQVAVQEQEVEQQQVILRQVAANQAVFAAQANQMDRSLQEALEQQAQRMEEQRRMELEQQARQMEQQMMAALKQQAEEIERERRAALEAQAAEMKEQISEALGVQAQTVQAERQVALQKQAEQMSRQMKDALDQQVALMEQRLQALGQREHAVDRRAAQIEQTLQARAVQLRRQNAAKTIQRWWFLLWERTSLDDTSPSAHWLKGDTGHQTVAQYMAAVGVSLDEDEVTPISPHKLLSVMEQQQATRSCAEEAMERRQHEALDELRSPRRSPRRAQDCGRPACTAERAELSDELDIARTEAKHLEAELRRVKLENTQLAASARDAGDALEVTRNQLQECRIELEQLKPLRMAHLKALLKSVVQKKLMRRRVRCMASLLREAKVPWAKDIKASHNVVIEFAQSEKAYVESLKVLIESFFPSIASFGNQIDREPHMHGAYTSMEITVQKLYTKHTTIRDMLHEVAYLKTGTDASLLGIVDRLCETITSDYDVYLAHLSKVAYTLDAADCDTAAMKRAIGKNTRKGKGLGITSFLFQPLQRVAGDTYKAAPFMQSMQLEFVHCYQSFCHLMDTHSFAVGYSLLCERLAKCTSPEHVLFRERVESASRVQGAAQFADERVRKFKQVETAFERFAVPLHPNLSPLLYVGQEICKQGSLYLVGEQWFATMNWCFLLQEALVFAVPKHASMSEPTVLLLHRFECSISESRTTLILKTKSALENQIFEFRTASEEECVDWRRAIHDRLANANPDDYPRIDRPADRIDWSESIVSM